MSSMSSGMGIQVELGPCRVVRDDKGKFTVKMLFESNLLQTLITMKQINI